MIVYLRIITSSMIVIYYIWLVDNKVQPIGHFRYEIPFIFQFFSSVTLFPTVVPFTHKCCSYMQQKVHLICA